MSSSVELSKHETRAINISLVVGIFMLGAKWAAFVLTDSAAIFSDAAESVVHIVAVAFAAYSLRVTYRPPDDDHHFGHDKITYFSAGVEGALIIIASGVIFYTAIENLIFGHALEQVTIGAGITLGAGLINGLLGWYLVKTGKENKSLILIANGKNSLTDTWTSLGAVIGLVLARLTGWVELDAIAAIIFGGNIIREGSSLLKTSINGLMDRSNPELLLKASELLKEFCFKNDISFHRLRLRESGQKIFVDFHMQFPDGTPIEKAHALATEAERKIGTAMPLHTDVFTHLESMDVEEDHI
ncbi:MAG: cation diffusion facilitator family transporter [Bacteroidota bacterium]